MAETEAVAIPEVNPIAELCKNSADLESLTLLLNKENLNKIADQIEEEFNALNQRQKDVRELQELMNELNAATEDRAGVTKEKVDALKGKLDEARKKGIAIKDPGKNGYSREEVDRILDGVRNKISDLNTQNDMQMQKITTLMQKQNESYQLARTILKTLNDDKVNKNRAINGR